MGLIAGTDAKRIFLQLWLVAEPVVDDDLHPACFNRERERLSGICIFAGTTCIGKSAFKPLPGPFGVNENVILPGTALIGILETNLRFINPIHEP